jgi:hypothetical protein
MAVFRHIELHGLREGTAEPVQQSPLSMNAVLWAIQFVLVLVLVPAAVVRALRYDFAKQRMAWVGGVPLGLLRFISVAEVLGGAGLVLPGLTHVAPELTSLAALGLAAIQLLAFLFHLRRHEPRNASANVLLLALLLVVANGRANVVPF